MEDLYMSDAAGPPENAELSTDQTKSLRVACKQEIPREAKVCASCKSYQADWKNRLQYFSGTVSLLAIAAAAVTWLSSQLSTTFQPDNVKLISFDSTGSAVIANFGPREVFVSNLHMYMLAGQPIWQGEKRRGGALRLDEGQEHLEAVIQPQPFSGERFALRKGSNDTPKSRHERVLAIAYLRSMANLRYRRGKSPSPGAVRHAADAHRRRARPAGGFGRADRRQPPP
jgi:hypothetical protein